MDEMSFQNYDAHAMNVGCNLDAQIFSSNHHNTKTDKFPNNSSNMYTVRLVMGHKIPNGHQMTVPTPAEELSSWNQKQKTSQTLYRTQCMGNTDITKEKDNEGNRYKK